MGFHLSLVAIFVLAGFVPGINAFFPVIYTSQIKGAHEFSLHAENKLTLIDDPDAISAPIPFRLEDSSNKKEGEENAIMCYVDCIARIDDVEYSVGFPCDSAVDIAYIEEDEDGEEGLVLIESDDDLMDKLFPIAKELVEEDESAKLALYRTPATLTLAGNLGIDDEDDEDENEEEDGEAAADLLLSFDFEGQEYNLVRPTDLMLLVGKADGTDQNQRVLISDAESEKIMPTLMEMLGL